MNDKTASKKLAELVARDRRFPLAAYEVILEGFEVSRREERVGPNVPPEALVCGVATSCAMRYGLLAPDVLRDLGIYRGPGLGAAIFLLVEADVLRFGPGEIAMDYARAGAKLPGAIDHCLATAWELRPPRIVAKVG